MEVCQPCCFLGFPSAASISRPLQGVPDCLHTPACFATLGAGLHSSFFFYCSQLFMVAHGISTQLGDGLFCSGQQHRLAGAASLLGLSLICPSKSPAHHCLRPSGDHKCSDSKTERLCCAITDAVVKQRVR